MGKERKQICAITGNMTHQSDFKVEGATGAEMEGPKRSSACYPQIHPYKPQAASPPGYLLTHRMSLRDIGEGNGS